MRKAKRFTRKFKCCHIYNRPTLTSGPETWPWGPVGWWRSLHDRVSRVPACKTSPRAKLESDRY